jgi:hypothetical protein
MRRYRTHRPHRSCGRFRQAKAAETLIAELIGRNSAAYSANSSASVGASRPAPVFQGTTRGPVIPVGAARCVRAGSPEPTPCALACVRASCRRGTQRGASYRNRTGRLGKWRKSWRKNWREYFSRRLDDPRSRIWTRDAGSRRRRDAGNRRQWDAGSRQRRRRILQGVHLRRQHGELTGYSFQIRLLGSGALREQHQHIGVLLLRRLNVPQSRPDHWIRYEDWSRVRRRRCSSDAIEIRRGEAAEVRQGETVNFRQRELIEIRQREATETRQGIGGGGTNDGQGGQGHRDHRHPARSHLLCQLGLFVSLRFPVRFFGHLRSLRPQPSRKILPIAGQQTKEPSR